MPKNVKEIEQLRSFRIYVSGLIEHLILMRLRVRLCQWDLSIIIEL